MLGIVLILGASPWLRDRWKQSLAGAWPLPPPGSANVILIVLDTVAAGHLSLYGYDRATSTTLEELALRAIRFDSAMAPSSWTLPSHATLFTGRWHHELSVGWLTPLDETRPTLAEFLGARATRRPASSPTLGIVVAIPAWRRLYLLRGLLLSGAHCLEDGRPGRARCWGSTCSCICCRIGWNSLRCNPLWHASGGCSSDNRKGAAVVNREFLDWLSQRTQPERPFLAFLNYVNAHAPYRLPPGRLRRFGVDPTGTHRDVLIQYWRSVDKTRVSREDLASAADAYDDCIADLDEQLGSLYDELDERGLLEERGR